ncbi:MAG TPA: zinc carboxypeptidase [Firmicutes bacterium]|nr:zinc carboxypeptidase [Candidatus Fermentithermobacillaceae bacterium]
MDVRSILSEVPDYQSFFTMDEMDRSSHQLAQEYPETVELFEIGRSRRGHPINCLKIGHGSRNVLAFASPHPNEPIGSTMLEFLTRKIASDPKLWKDLDVTWYCIKSVDPDGTKLNEGWFKGPYNILNYARNFFRPAGFEQVEWTFPFEYKTLKWDKPIPETAALAALIREIKPVFMYSLHNAGFGGVYWYISEDMPEVYPKLWALVDELGLPLRLGEPEMPYAKAFAKAVYRQSSTKDNYEYVAKFQKKDPALVIKHGGGSFDFVKEVCDAFTLVCEAPYFFNTDIANLSDSDMLRSEAVLVSCDISDEFNDFCREHVQRMERYVTPGNSLFTAVKAFSQAGSSESKRNWAMTSPECQRMATVAEKFTNLYSTRFYSALSVGMLMRSAQRELCEDPDAPEDKAETLKQVRDLAWDKLKATCEFLEREIDYQVVPIRKLVTIQLASGLYYLHEVLKKS